MKEFLDLLYMFTMLSVSSCHFFSEINLQACDTVGI